MIKENGITYLDDTVYNYFCNEQGPKTLYRYMDYKKMQEGELWFSNPAIWIDPYEKLFLDSTYLLPGEKIKFPLLNCIFCFCLTTTSSSDAAWRVYDCDTKFCTKAEKLVQALKEHTKDYDVYIGSVNYKSQTSLERDSVKKLIGVSTFNSSSDEAWVRLLLLKRKAFDYEKEIRIILVKKEEPETPQAGMSLKSSIPMKTLFYHVELSPFLDPSKIEATKTSLFYKFYFAPEQITISDMYTAVKPRRLMLY